MSPQTSKQKILFKNRLKDICQKNIEDRIAITRKQINNAQSAANSEEKSSAGDKYETSRAMSHIDKDMHSRQLEANINELNHCKMVNTNKIYDTAVAGSMITCAEITFFLLAGLGKQIIDEEVIMFLSPAVPLAKALLNKKAGDTFLFNKQELLIVEIY